MFYLRVAIAALQSLETHFLRSLLATLGVLIGVGSVVACMSILEGASGQILQDLQTLGSNILFVGPSVARIEGRMVGAAQTLEIEDMLLLQRELGDKILAISAEAVGPAVVKRMEKSENATVVAASETYFQIHGFEADRGRVLNRSEANDELALVVCLGAKIAEKLFGGSDPVNETIKIGNSTYRVVGLMEKRGNVGFINADEAVFIPIKSGLKRFFNRKWLNWLTVQVSEPEQLDDLQKSVTSQLRRAHRIRPGQEDDFRLFTQEEVLRNVNEATLIFRVVFYSIAGISLIVGGIGIMNIMLVSVTERTREIGVRIAVGARRGDIMTQFLVEALIISLLGGGAGLMLGWMFADLLDKCLRDMFRTEITTSVVVTALVTTTLVGVISGIYPAFKASRLDPVEALRYE